MDTSTLKKFAQAARRQLIEQVAARMEQVLRTDSVEIREKAQVVEELKKQIAATSKEDVVDRVAYTWFNRFCALRFMDVNHYTRVGLVSPLEGHTQPEVLAEAKLGVIDKSFAVDQARVFDLLNGRYPSSNPQQEAYRLLLVGASNAWHERMPFLFPKIEDYTELLMPDDLLSENSVLQGVRETLTPAACEDVEVIGWLYQYYISERKDEVFAALKQRKKIEAGDIPAATQLFTPHWIVRYLVENSLGRLWMLNHPDSKLAQAMDYYIAPEQPETDFLQLGSPEEIRVADPACGSGHMLTYAFDLLYAIYEEEGYDPVQIPRLILEKNLYGIEIDKRAGDLAAFALTMKARAKDRRFFRRDVEPNICVLENVHFSASELADYKKKIGNDLFTQNLWVLLTQFEQADNFGSLIRPQVRHPEQMLERLEELGAFDDLLLYSTNEKVKKVLTQAEYLSPRYHVVVANPPYMRLGNCNTELRDFARDQFPISKPDLFSMFIERNLVFLIKNGFAAMITMQSWMFLTSFEKLRRLLVSEKAIVTMAHLGARAFDTIGGEVVSTTAFVIENLYSPTRKGAFLRLVSGSSEAEKEQDMKKNINNPYLVSGSDLAKIPACPIAYWLSDITRSAFSGNRLSNLILSEGAVKTGNNKLYLRQVWEVAGRKVSEKGKWRKHPKGGDFRKWYGNMEWVVDWTAEARKHYKDDYIARIPVEDIWNISGITWTAIASGKPSFRLLTEDEIANNSALFVYPKDKKNLMGILCYLNSMPARMFLNVLNPTIQYLVGDIMNTPLPSIDFNLPALIETGERLLEIEKDDWDSCEVSWDFSSPVILAQKFKRMSLSKSYTLMRAQWENKVDEVIYLETSNNKIFIESFELEDELNPEVLVEEVTLISNPYYRYDSKKSKPELEALLLADTMQEFISYAVGCMFGRYSLDKPGLVLANAGESLEDYIKIVTASDSEAALPTEREIASSQERAPRNDEISFMPDADNVIPILDGEWFEDDIAERFKQFLKVTFGTEHYEENLAFLEDAIGRDIRSYFVKDFYKNHVKMYKKRPIYWLFSSPKGSFNALIYMHRYRPDTVSVILNGYLRQYREKLKAHKSHLQAVERNPDASQREKTRAIKEGDKIEKVLAELKEYEDEILFPLAAQQLEIDLDDGVKVNYPRFGDALKKVSGLS